MHVTEAQNKSCINEIEHSCSGVQKSDWHGISGPKSWGPAPCILLLYYATYSQYCSSVCREKDMDKGYNFTFQGITQHRTCTSVHISLLRTYSYGPHLAVGQARRCSLYFGQACTQLKNGVSISTNKEKKYIIMLSNMVATSHISHAQQWEWLHGMILGSTDIEHFYHY